MNNELFDRMMKDNLNKVNVTPSQGLKKTIGKKLFFQNILNFHKAKVVVATLFMGTAGVLSYGFFNIDSSSALSTKEYQASNEVIERIDKINDEFTIISDKSIADKSSANITNDNLNVKENVLEPVDNVDENVSQNTNSGNDSKDNFSGSDVANNAKSKNNNKDNKKSLDTKKVVIEKDVVRGEKNLNDIDKLKSVDEVIVAVNKTTMKVEDIQSGMYHAAARPVKFEDYLSTPVSVQEANIAFNNKPIIRKELSVDVYKSMMATNDVDNSLKSEAHQEFNWDFYNENEQLKTTSLGGIDVNYAVGTKVFKGKVSLGVNASQIIEQKPTYEFEEITDPEWLEVFKVDELSWVNTYGEDTCTQCFFAKNSSELQDELKNENNIYKYVSVPLKLGAEVNLKYVSIDVMGGMQWNHLTNASGLYVKEKMPENRHLYYWNDMEISPMDKNNDMLKRNYFSWTASANLRVRITRQFDLMAGYDMVFSNGNITKDKYLMDKSLKYAQAKIGITFYPNRLPIQKLK